MVLPVLLMAACTAWQDNTASYSAAELEARLLRVEDLPARYEVEEDRRSSTTGGLAKNDNAYTNCPLQGLDSVGNVQATATYSSPSTDVSLTEDLVRGPLNAARSWFRDLASIPQGRCRTISLPISTYSAYQATVTRIPFADVGDGTLFFRLIGDRSSMGGGHAYVGEDYLFIRKGAVIVALLFGGPGMAGVDQPPAELERIVRAALARL